VFHFDILSHKLFVLPGLAMLGLTVGSFLNVCIWRIPRGGSIIRPGSSCPLCGSHIRPTDNIPLLSYLLLGGRCRYCKGGIAPRYPLVEALNAALYLLVHDRFGLGWHLPVYLVFVSSLLVITFIDLDFQIIPDSITLPGIPLALAAGSLLMPDPFMRAYLLGYKASFIGAISGFGFFYAVAVLSRGGMGGGDVKLMGMVGAMVGWKGVVMTTFAGSLAGSLFGLYLMLFKGKGRKTKVPFGPFLALGSLVSLLWGQEILQWYIQIHGWR
jgi:leader peptidase (prepilin peptidase)/N-methyltransferase